MATYSDAKKVAKQQKSFELPIGFGGTRSSMLLRTSFGATPLFRFFWEFGGAVGAFNLPYVPK
ncbi:MAG: hypothetical protein VX772_09370, partial [Bacteroidota bacterium]|nr:hypothetical protein [Bacteroidota bacterium]